MLTGRVDDFQNGKIFGWAFNSDNTDEHLLIRISFGSQVVASGVANLVRPDLPDAGVGKGDHAFEILMPPHIVSLKGLVAMAQSSRHGDAVLPIASNDERHMDDLFQVFSDRYDDALHMLKAEIDKVRTEFEAARETETPPLPQAIESRLVALESRMEASEIFLMRIDELLRKQSMVLERQKTKGWFRLFGSRARA